MYLLGFDIGSSSVKATLLDAARGTVTSSATSPSTELPIQAVRQGWAEQHPDTWWEHVVLATKKILAESGVDRRAIKAIGISYQMHGLVVVDRDQKPLRSSIIWCDSRAVEIGDKAFQAIGSETALSHLLNSPGNFTASKLRWVRENEPDLYRKIYRFMLPGDYIGMKMTGKAATTASGLSEGILWDYTTQSPADIVLDYYDIDRGLLSEIVPTFGHQGELTAEAAAVLGLSTGTPVTYRAGDQPNNALSLNVLAPGEVAATAGTSGVVYGVTDKAKADSASRVNTFLHVSHTPAKPRYGVLLCVNGTGILNSWLKHQVIGDMSSGEVYPVMNDLAAAIPTGSAGLSVIPFGNGAERTLENRNIGASIHGLSLTTHTRGHLFRAAQEGIAFALAYGVEIMGGVGVEPKRVRAGHANMFLSPVFRSVFAATTGAVVELYATDGSQGAARGAGIGAGIYKTPEDAFVGLTAQAVVEPDSALIAPCREAYARWREILDTILARRQS